MGPYMKSLPLFDALNQRLRWLSARQQTVSQNIANANTPGYKPKDVKGQDFSALLDQVRKAGPAQGTQKRLKQTHSAHLVAGGVQALQIKASELRDFEEVTPNNNAVVLEEELIKMADVQMEYNLVLNVYRKHMGIMRNALGRGRG